MKDGQVLATVDLGSNSFRIEMARFDHGQLVRLDYYKEPVRLGAGLDANSNLTPEAIERGVACLARFSERLRGVAPHAVRAVATQSLRSAKNPDAFLIPAQAALGYPIEVISGQEEARLIYQGVSNDLPNDHQMRLVVDIGGGSTEVIVGVNNQPHRMESFRIGCVSHTLRFFDGQKYSVKNFDKAVLAATAIFEEGVTLFHAAHWQLAYGSSGTVEAIAEICATTFGHAAITLDGLMQLRQIITTVEQKKWPFEALKTQRGQVLAGGVAVLLGLYRAFGVTSMLPCYSALRQGVMVDLIHRSSGHLADDAREQSIARLMKRWSLDAQQAMRVQHIALALFKQIAPQAQTQWLKWAACCHEIGMIIAHEGAHRHGDYIVRNADLAGFSRAEQAHLADLISVQRGGLKKWQEVLKKPEFAREAVCLRIAILLSHARAGTDLPATPLQFDANQLIWTCDAQWVAQFPLSAYLIEEECRAWEKIGVQTKLVVV